MAHDEIACFVLIGFAYTIYCEPLLQALCVCVCVCGFVWLFANAARPAIKFLPQRKRIHIVMLIKIQSGVIMVGMVATSNICHCFARRPLVHWINAMQWTLMLTASNLIFIIQYCVTNRHHQRMIFIYIYICMWNESDDLQFVYLFKWLAGTMQRVPWIPQRQREPVAIAITIKTYLICLSSYNYCAECSSFILYAIALGGALQCAGRDLVCKSVRWQNSTETQVVNLAIIWIIIFLHLYYDKCTFECGVDVVGCRPLLFGGKWISVISLHF